MTMLPAGKVSCFGLSAALFGGDCGSDRVGELFDLDVLTLQYFEQLDLAIRVGWVGGDHISGRAFEHRLLDGALALGVVVLEEMVGVVREVRKR